VADICGTNPALWNAWKDSLLKELYQAAKALMRQEQRLLDETLLISNRKKEALIFLIQKGFSEEIITVLWDQFKGKYFLHESPEIIAQHTSAILKCRKFPLVLIMPHHSLGGTEVFIYMPHKDERFTISTSVLNNYHVSIQEALISTCNNQFDLDTYIILDEQNQIIFDQQKLTDIQNALYTHLSKPKQLPPISKKRLPRAMSHFEISPQITYSEDRINHHTQLFLITNDRPGLLATISSIFLDLCIHLHNAKIATAGERVEDMFYITNKSGLPLTTNEKELLKENLINGLDKNNKVSK
jgi:[protein-PII] uridylyltransferase